jgi:hypothetical protein
MGPETDGEDKQDDCDTGKISFHIITGSETISWLIIVFPQKGDYSLSNKEGATRFNT